MEWLSPSEGIVLVVRDAELVLVEAEAKASRDAARRWTAAGAQLVG